MVAILIWYVHTVSAFGSTLLTWLVVGVSDAFDVQLPASLASSAARLQLNGLLLASAVALLEVAKVVARPSHRLNRDQPHARRFLKARISKSVHGLMSLDADLGPHLSPFKRFSGVVCRCFQIVKLRDSTPRGV